MRKNNGYGSVIKLGGKRRKPFAVRLTAGWDDNGKQIFRYIGYYEKKNDAEIALADYNKNPYELSQDITFSELYEKWKDEHFPKVSESNCRGYMASYRACSDLHDKKVADIKLTQLQAIIDNSDKNKPTLKKMKVLWGLMYDYGVKYELIPNERREMIRYVDLSKKDNPNKYTRTIFTEKEIKKLWQHKNNNQVKIMLMLIYTGVRISELLDLKNENIHIEEHYFDIVASKTDAGIRSVPIADKIYPFFKELYEEGNEYLLTMKSTGRKFLYRNYKDAYWIPVLNEFGFDHKPHDARHTFISLMTIAEVDARIIKAIVGHSGSGVTEQVYTHFPMDKLLDAVNLI